jgi:hypothetical protein
VAAPRRGEIAGLVDLLDDLAGDHQVRPRQKLAGLGEEMVLEGDSAVGGEAVEVRPLAGVGAAAADGVEAEAAVEPPQAVGGAVLVDVLVVEIHVERPVGDGVAARHEHIGSLGLRRLRRGGRIRLRRLGVELLAAAAVEQGILVQLLGDEALDLEVGERQQSDRLLELRRHHQRLALPEVEARPDRHGYSSKRSPR